MTGKRAAQSNLPRLTELEEQTAALWLRIGTITETARGEENTYYRDEFDNEFYRKNYPRSPCSLETCERAFSDYLEKRALETKPSPGPSVVCWETQEGELPIRLSFAIKCF